MSTLRWVGRSKEELKRFPADVQDVVGYALYLAEKGGKHPDAKPLRGFSGAGVLEVVDDFDGDTYRAVYTVRFTDAVYVLHCFQKKSKQGRATPRNNMELIRRRLAVAEQASQDSQRGAAKSDALA